MILKKKEEGPYWPQLTKLKQRYHWLKINFNKWKEEDDSDVEEEENFEDVTIVVFFKILSNPICIFELLTFVYNPVILLQMIRSIGDLGTGSRPSFENDTDSDDNDKDAEDDLPPLE